MRLGQLTRQLNVGANKIVSYLKSEDITIENHPNTKLDDTHIELITSKFAQKTNNATDALENAELLTPEKDSTLDIIKENIVEPATEKLDSIKDIIEDKIDDTKDLLEDKAEIIEDKFEEISDKVEDLGDSIKDKAEDTLESLKETASDLKDKVQETISDIKGGNSPEEETSEEEEPKIVTLPKEQVEKMVAEGEIVSELEAQAATLEEDGKITANLKKLDGLKVVDKIELPSDPRREKKEEERKKKEELDREKSLAGKTIDGVHPTKRMKDEMAKLVAEENAVIAKKIEQQKKRELAKQKREEAASKKSNKAKSKKKSKKKSQPKEKVLSPEELKKKKAREKRQEQKLKANAPKPKRNFFQKIWDAIK